MSTTDPAREWWQQPLYIEMESPRMYVDLTAPDPAPPTMSPALLAWSRVAAPDPSPAAA
jgi:hypothetical protein